jgi:hypothetical protein
MLGNLPFDHTFDFSGSVNSYQIAFIQADADYLIDEVAVVPDANAVTNKTFSAFVALVTGGSDTASKATGTAVSTVEGAAPAIGGITQGILQDPTDPTGKGVNAVKLLALVSIGNSFLGLPEGVKQRLKQGQLLVLGVLNSTKANAGIVTIAVTGHQVPRADQQQ